MTYGRSVIPSVLVLALLALALLAGGGTGQAQTQEADLDVTKSVNPQSVAPGDGVVYTVTLDNTSGAPLMVTSLLDTLPDGFEYVGLAPGCENPLGEPDDAVPPKIGWTEPFPVDDSVTVCYKVYVPTSVPLSPDPYVNEVIALVGDDSYTAAAGLMVAVADVTVTKEATPYRAEPGGLITYTVAFDNSGYVPASLAVVTDVLPAGVTWLSMTGGSDVAAEPDGTTGMIAWSGPFEVPASGELVVEYQVAAPMVTETVQLVNEAWGRLEDGTELAPAGAEVVVSTGASTLYLPFIARNYTPPAFTATKSANPDVGFTEPPGTLIAYTVTFANVGGEAGVLADVRDVLPAGFTFVTMLPGSDVSDAPAGTTGEIVWDGPFTVPGGSSLTLIYQVRATTTPGTYVNSATATVTKGRPPDGPATATVVVREPILLEEEWENPSPDWEEFLNYYRLKPEQWHIKPGGSNDGSAALGHTFWLGGEDAHDALISYKGPGAEEWTDYVYQSRGILYFDDGSRRGQFGMWFRGTMNQEGQLPGRYVTGYYFTLQPGPPMRILLLQMRTDDECGNDCAYNYHFSNPILLDELRGEEITNLGLSIDLGRWYWLRVEVVGPQIRCYVDDVLVFDYYDNVGTTFTEGSVGFYTYIAGDARFDHVTVEPWQ